MTTSDDAHNQDRVGRQNTELQNNEPTEIETLLPWHAVGTLRRGDRRRVEEALRSDPALARQADLVREELAETIRLNETLGAPSARAMERLMAAIDADALAAHKRGSLRATAGRVADFITGLSPRTLAIAGSLAALVIVAQASVLVSLLTKPQGLVQTASLRRHLHGTFAMVHFVRQASAGEITNFLEANEVKLVDGPQPGGIYRLRLSTRKLTQEEIGQIASRMHQAPIVDFVQVNPQ